jgi:predicted hotdog family 3-hydroxylacyl-ACP dehydratase
MSKVSFPPVTAYVPHRGAMLLIDRVVAVDADQVQVELVVPEDGWSVRDGGAPAWIGVEYMAQAIAAWAGARARREKRPPPLGFLLGTRRYEAQVDSFPSGATLQVHARCELLGDNGLCAFDCRIVRDGQTVAEAMLSVFEPSPGALLDDGATP